jgi:hypothetical protein
LHTGWGSTYPRKNKLTDTELVYVAIAYNAGHADLNKDFRQGFKDNGKYYGEYIRDYMALSKITPPAQ